MKHIIIGTAGHIDHGKTTLIRALTGRNTDRLKEEIKRGISIDLGFTYFDLPSGRRAGIIDVPGHERFIKNMIAGAGGIDIVLLCVDATEGVKPQTMEHVEIVGFLGIREGIIVLTKAGAADECLRELVADDIREKLKGTFFEDKEMVLVDSVTGYGLESLTTQIDALTERTRTRNMDGPARLNIDRVFTVKGFGTVVTGTLTEGTLHENDELILHTSRFPDTPVKVKNIQVHDVKVPAAYAGQRTALNLTGVKASVITRGDVLAAEGSVVRTAIADARITLTPHTELRLKMWDRLRVYTGARELFARYVPFSEDEGENAFCQLRFEQEAFLRKGDLLVIRRYSPMETVGGGVIVDPSPVKRRHADLASLADLSKRLEGSFTDAVDSCLRGTSKPTDAKTLVSLSALDEAQVAEALEILIKNRIAYKINAYYLHAELMDEYSNSLAKVTALFHNENPLLPGIPKETLRSKAGISLKPRDFDALLSVLCGEGSFKAFDNLVALAGFAPRYNEKQRRIRDTIEKAYLNAGFTPPAKSEMATDKATREVFDAMVKQILIPLDDETFLHIRHMEAAKEMIREHCEKHGTLTLAEFRDLTKSSRKYCLLILEYLDNRRFTQRDSDRRRIFP